MLQQRYRFHGSSSLRHVYRRGTTVRSRLFAIRFVRQPHRSDSRCSVVVARKVVKAAPRRNRIRRRMYEIMRTNWQQLVPGCDIIITVYGPSLIDMPHQQLQTALMQTLGRAKLLQTASVLEPSIDEKTPRHKKSFS